MRACVFWLCLGCACTQNFGAFDPLDAASDAVQSGDGGSDATSNDAAVSGDASADTSPVDTGPDVVSCNETGAILFGGHCYFLIGNPHTQQVAAQTCTSAGAHLVSITSASEQAAVIALGSGTERWIGLFRNGGPPKDNTYNWITGEARNGFNAWSPTEPNGTGQCATLLPTGLWNDQDCAQSLAFICERE